jgi:nitroreductase
VSARFAASHDNPPRREEPMTELGVLEAIATARALRRLKPDPVPQALIDQVLAAAVCAPSAGNAQNWIFLVVRDAETRRKLGAIYRKASDIASAMYAARGRPAHLSEEQFGKLMTSGAYLWDHMGDAPVILVPCQARPVIPPREALPADVADTLEREKAYVERIRGASIYPAVQNIILACRALGLAATITTNHIRCEDEVKAVLGVPDDIHTFAMMPIGWPHGRFGPVARRPVAEVTFADRWGNAWPGG